MSMADPSKESEPHNVKVNPFAAIVPLFGCFSVNDLLLCETVIFHHQFQPAFELRRYCFNDLCNLHVQVQGSGSHATGDEQSLSNVQN